LYRELSKSTFSFNSGRSSPGLPVDLGLCEEAIGALAPIAPEQAHSCLLALQPG